jgi:beta-glucosidase
MSDLGRLIMPALRLDHGPGATDEALANFHSLGAGGFVVFGGTRERVVELTADLQAWSDHPLLLASDLERGAGQQFAGLSQFPPLLALARLEERSAIGGGKVSATGAATASQARRVGINMVFAPVLDLDVEPANPIVQTRSLGADASVVGRLGAEWIEGCQAAGPLACAKHFPGHGRTKMDSHATLPTVVASPAKLKQDLAPFRDAVAKGVAAIMTAHVAYLALDPTGAPATFSKPIIDILRRDLGFDGLVVTDALIMAGAASPGGEAESAIRALNAGCDLLLYPQHPHDLQHELELALRRGTLSMQRVDESLERWSRAVERAWRHPRFSAMTHEFIAEAAADISLFSLEVLRGEIAAVPESVAIEVVDDDVGGPYPLPPRDAFEQELRARGRRVDGGGFPIVLVFADVKSWKGRAGLSDTSRARLAALVRANPATPIVLFGHPRRLAEIPGEGPVLCAWSGDVGMQRAAARGLAEGVGELP